MRKAYLGKQPLVDASAFLAENTALIGDVQIGPQVSIWYGVTIRGDINSVSIGARSNIQEGSSLHVDRAAKGPDHDPAWGKLVIGNDVTVGHKAILHGCTIEDNCLIGMGAIILTGARIGTGSLVAAGALVREGRQIPPRSLVVGMPAVVKSTLGDEKVQAISESARHYCELAENHKREPLLEP